MQPSDTCDKLVRHFEGLGDGDLKAPNLQAYICPAGVATAGYGHVLYHPVSGKQLRVDTFGRVEALRQAAVALTNKYGRPYITVAEAEALLAADLDKFGKQVFEALGSKDTSQNRFDAMVSFAFNVGVGAFKSSTVLKRHLAGKLGTGSSDIKVLCANSKTSTITDIYQAFCAWNKSEGKWSLGLFKRRWVEAKLYNGADLKNSLLIADAFKG